MDGIEKLQKETCVRTVRGDMCQYGMKQRTTDGDRYVFKPTGCMTNSQSIAAQLQRRRTRQHEQTPLVNGRADLSEVYPEELCLAILKGLRQQLHADGRMRSDLNVADCDSRCRRAWH